MLKDNRKQIVDYIMKKHGFYNYEVKCISECPIESRRKKGGSWCDYHENGTTIIYLRENETDDLEDIIVAAHEASHAINYRDSKINIKELKKKSIFRNIFMVLGLVVPTCSLGVLFFAREMLILNTLIFLCFLTMISSTYFIFNYYTLHKQDEINAETLSNQELNIMYKNNTKKMNDIKKRINKRIKEVSVADFIGFVVYDAFIIVANTAIIWLSLIL
ncbi:hypothetical protein [Bacillus cereus]|uniref:hypothetical protein n=2 Tax=Bacillus cereus TaxID=1396 RepID=UPI00397EE90D